MKAYLGAILAFTLPTALQATGAPSSSPNTTSSTDKPSLARATFAGGCFWCMEPPFEKLTGVQAVISGYTGGKEKNPTYDAVSSGQTSHTEAVEVVYDPRQVSYATLLETFWRSMNPTDTAGQFADRGRQYRPGIFVRNAEQRRLAEASKKNLASSGRFSKPITTPILSFTAFYAAEEYHQDFYKKNPVRYYGYRKGSGREDFLKKTWGASSQAPLGPVHADNDGVEKMTQGPEYSKPSDSAIKANLSPEQYQVTQKNGTERPFRNAYWDHKAEGLYVDIVSGEPLFSSRDKFESGTGWPSFTQPVEPAFIVEKSDVSHGMKRVEVRSKLGDSHLGHVFDDGPKPTGLRYCINSAALRFIPKEKLAAEGYGEYAKLFP